LHLEFSDGWVGWAISGHEAATDPGLSPDYTAGSRERTRLARVPIAKTGVAAGLYEVGPSAG